MYQTRLLSQVPNAIFLFFFSALSVADYRCNRIHDYFWARHLTNQYVMAGSPESFREACRRQSGEPVNYAPTIHLHKLCLDIALSFLPTPVRVISKLFQPSYNRMQPVLCFSKYIVCGNNFKVMEKICDSVVTSHYTYYKNFRALSNTTILASMKVFSTHRIVFVGSHNSTATTFPW